MSDIVKVLRGKYALDYDEKTLDQFCNEAADEIERLIDAIEAAQECIDADDVVGAYDVLTKAINGKNLDD